MNFWQILYITIALSSLGASLVQVLVISKEQRKGKSAAHVTGMVIGTAVAYALCLFLLLGIGYGIYTTHSALWAWLGCTGGGC